MTKKILLFSSMLSMLTFSACTSVPVKTTQSNPSQETKIESNTANNGSKESSEEMIKEKEEYIKEYTETSSEKNESSKDINNNKPIFQEYSKSSYQTLKGKTPLVLFFYAPWCPLCREQDKNITADLSNFPEGTKILRTDYDTETALKQEYGITIQTTFIVLDESGKVSSKLHDPSLQELKTAITNSLDAS